MAEINSIITQRVLMPTKLSEDKKRLERMDEKNIKGQTRDDFDLNDEMILLENKGQAGLSLQEQSDELASLITLFRQRRDWERKKVVSDDATFDHILEEGNDTLDKINRLFQLIRSDTSADVHKLVIYMRGFFNDESDIYLALQALLRKKNLAEELKEKLEQAIRYLEETTDHKKLKSGVNIAVKARLFSSKLAMKPAIIRSSYRQFLEYEGRALDIYYIWIIQFGYSKRNIILDFMESALLTDMMSLDPSCSKREFGNLLTRIKQLNILHSAETILVENIKKNPLLMQLNDNASSWFNFFYHCITDPQKVQNEMMLLSHSRFKFFSYDERGKILQTIYQIFMTIPTEIFEDIEYKERVKHALTGLNDSNCKQKKSLN